MKTAKDLLKILNAPQTELNFLECKFNSCKYDNFRMLMLWGVEWSDKDYKYWGDLLDAINDYIDDHSKL